MERAAGTYKIIKGGTLPDIKQCAALNDRNNKINI